jgi:hypothetical protein
VKSLLKSVLISASPEAVFRYVDDIRNTGWHMTKSSMPLMGSKLELEIISKKESGRGATYHWSGKVMGFTIDFLETVTRWQPNEEKRWRTVNEPRLLIISNYEMWFRVQPVGSQTRLSFGIEYDLPEALVWRVLGWLLAGWYCNWCLGRMTIDAKNALEQPSASMIEAK